MVKILGIDPGSRQVGFGLIQQKAGRAIHKESGCIRVNTSNPLPQRLVTIYDELKALIIHLKPQHIAIETMFIKYAQPALKLGQARGVILLAAEKQHIPIYEYTPRKIKQAISSYGGADKQQMQRMIKMLLQLDDLPKEDQADALGVALCHIHYLTYSSFLNQ